MDALHRESVRLTSFHVDLFPTLFDLAAGEEVPAERTLVVESQRIRHPQKYRAYAVMRNHSQLVDGLQLSDLRVRGRRSTWRRSSRDWRPSCGPRTSRTGRASARETRGSAAWTSLTAEHIFPDDDDGSVWNQQHVLVGAVVRGDWPVTVAESGTFRLECRRWPREVDAPMAGVPATGALHAHSDAGGPRPAGFLFDVEMPGTLYGAKNGGTAATIPVAATIDARRLTQAD